MATENNGLVYWADGDTQNAILANDIESAADILGIGIEDVNQCTAGQMAAYGVAMKEDIFQAPAGLAR